MAHLSQSGAQLEALKKEAHRRATSIFDSHATFVAEVCESIATIRI